MNALRSIGGLVLFFLVGGSAWHLHGGEPKGALSGFAVQRSWSNDSGQFRIDAKLVFADEQSVKLAKTDGKTVTVPLDRLSSADKAFIQGFLQAEAALAMADQAEAQSANPFAGGEPTQPSAAAAAPAASGETTSEAGAGEIPTRNAVVKGIRPVSVSPGKEFWEVEALHGFPDVTFQEMVVPTPVEKPFFAALRMNAAGRSGNVIINSYQENRGNRGAFGRFAFANSATGDVSPVLELSEPWKLMDVSADGKRAAAVRIEGFDKGNDVALLRVANGRIVPEFQFTAGGGAWDELHYVAFLPGNRLMTISQKHNLTIWDLDNPAGPRAMYRGNSGGKLWAELSPAGELLAMIAGKSIAFVDTAAFQLKGFIARDEEALHMAFSPNGKTLAAYHPFTVTLYSMETGEEISSFAVSESSGNAKLLWTGDHLLLESVLYDVERGVPLWTYENKASAKSVLGNYLFSVFGGDKQSTLTVYKVPHAEALRVANEIDPNNIYCLKPGDSVRVNYQLSGVPADQQAKIREAVEEKLSKLGWQQSSGATNVLEIKLEQGEREEAEYFTRSGFGPVFFSPFSRPSGPSEKFSYRAWKHTLTVRTGGQQVYHAAMNRGAPQNLTTKDGESTQAAVNRFCQPYADYFKNLAIPPHVLKPEYQGGLGKSVVSASGMN